jgi:guanine deaminase
MKPCNCIQPCNCGSLADPRRRSFLAATAAGLAAAAVFPTTPAEAALDPDRRRFMEEATRLATESVQKGLGGPFGAVIVKDGEIIGRGQNRVFLTGCPVYHAEITAIIDASGRLNPKGLLGSDYGQGTILELIPRPTDSPDLVPQRAKMLKGCDIYINGAPCPMCMSAIYWSRIDHLYFGASLEDTSHIGFPDEFQYQDFTLPWGQRKGIAVTSNFERETALAAYQAWENNRTWASSGRTELAPWSSSAAIDPDWVVLTSLP